MNNWIDITEYATRYGVSQSTLRRRIRTQSIAFRMERGKYLLEDTVDLIQAAPLFSRKKDGELKPSHSNKKTKMVLTQSAAPVLDEQSSRTIALPDPVEAFLALPEILPIHFHSELKDLKIENRRLNSRIVELETLVRVLDSQNA